MIQLITCTECGGFLALALRACPHCEAPLGRVRRMILGAAVVAGGGAVSMTLMACYGGACVNEDCRAPRTPAEAGEAVDASTD